VIILDTSGVLSALDASERHHEASAWALRGAGAPRLLSPFVLAELDYLLATRVSTRVQRAFLREVAAGAYRLEGFDSGDVAEANEVLDRYADLGVGLADASLVVLARRYRVTDILTLDERHFRVVRAIDDRPFRILPSDAPLRR
jgi:predicted nucleic acid-binding protein